MAVNKTRKHFSIRKINRFFLSLTGLLCLGISISLILLQRGFQKYVYAGEEYIKISKAAMELQDGSDYLTEQVRLFVLFQNFTYMDNYFTEVQKTRRREHAVDKISHSSADAKVINLLSKALAHSIQLEQLEYYAMRLTVQAMNLDKQTLESLPEEVTDIQLSDEDLNSDSKTLFARAWMLLFSQEYFSKKIEILNLKNRAVNSILNQTQGMYDSSFYELKDNFIMTLIAIIGIFIMNLSLFGFIIKFIIHPLYRFIKNIKAQDRLEDTRIKELAILGTTYNDMFDLNKSNEELLKHKAEHDELTDLINRTAFNNIKESLRNSKKPLAIIIIDIDFFKIINDTYGHLTGDRVLKRVANALSANFRTSDYVARVGGDEFAVIITGCYKEQEKTVALISKKMEAIKSILSDNIGDTPGVTLSCGVATGSEGYDDTLYEQADMALYQVKRAGRNDFKFYENSAEFEK